jgi:subtilisin family serine protease
MPIDDSPSTGDRAMSAVWQQSDCTRPDPYLEWEYRTRCDKLKETWCSVQIQVVPASDGTYLPSLRQLYQAVVKGRQDDDDVGPNTLTIRMADDEQEHLKNLVDRKSHEKNQTFERVEMQFFIYRLERLIYLGGNYRNPAFYTAISVGPPIEGLKFNEDRTGFHPTQLHVPLITAGLVAIGIIDDGIAFANQRFRSSLQASRVQAIWLQEPERRRSPDNGVAFGQRLNNDQINELLKSCDSEDEIYRCLGLTDFGKNIYNPLASRAAHGTHVLDLACGYTLGKGELRPILAVQLPSVATIDTSGVTMGSYVLQGVRAIMLWANKLGKIPLVINFSYGLLAGPKDGREQLEVALAELIDYRNEHVAPTRLVMPAGNSYRTRAAAKFALNDGEPRSLEWVILPDDGAANFLEVWLDGGAGEQGDSSVEISLTPQDYVDGEFIRPKEGVVHELVIDGSPAAGIYYQVFGTRERILLAVNPTVRTDDGRHLAPAGRWKLSVQTEGTITAHIYVQRDDTPFGYPRRGRQSYLDHAGAYERDDKTGDYRFQEPGCPIIYQETLSAIATSPTDKPDHTIVVGAAEASEFCPPADYTSSGPTESRPGPDCSAIADDGDAHWGVLAAGAFSGSVVAMRGTSVAAPQIVRHVADDLPSMHATPPAPPPGSILVSPENLPRLGQYVLRPAENLDIPRRRYPAI